MKKKKRKVKIRRVWRINPETRVKPSDKKYKRTRAKSNVKKILENEA